MMIVLVDQFGFHDAFFFQKASFFEFCGGMHFSDCVLRTSFIGVWFQEGYCFLIVTL